MLAKNYYFGKKAIVKFNNNPFEYILRNHDHFHHVLYTDAATMRGFGRWDSLVSISNKRIGMEFHFQNYNIVRIL